MPFIMAVIYGSLKWWWKEVPLTRSFGELTKDYAMEDDTPTPPLPPTDTASFVETPTEGDHVGDDTRSLEDVAYEVLAGMWGTGQDRRKALADAGYDHVEVRRKVKELLNQ